MLITEKDSSVSKDQMIKILRTLSHFRPKQDEYLHKHEKAAGYFTQKDISNDIMSVRHRELIQEKKDKFITVPVHMAKFVYQNLTKGILKDMFTDHDAQQDSKLKTNLFEVLQAYIQLYSNLEVRINDFINQKRLGPIDALDSLTSYAIAEEGTNTLYLGLVELICQRDAVAQPYTLKEIELLLNYFPHAILQDTQNSEVNGDITVMRDKFYFPILHHLMGSWEVMTTEQFLAIFQGLTLAGSKVLTPEVLNQILNQFVERIEGLKFDETVTFFELFIKFSRQQSHSIANQTVGDMLDKSALVDLANEKFFAKQSALNLFQITCMYWIYSSIGSFWNAEIL